MDRCGARTQVSWGLLALGLAAGATACGSAAPSTTPVAHETRTAAPQATGLLDHPWLLRFSADGGADGELVTAVYVRFTPSSGAVTVRKLPGLRTSDTYSGSSALLVSADEKYALLDSHVTATDRDAGRLTLYPTGPGDPRHLDLRPLTGVSTLKPVGAAFDPADGEVLRVVDTERRIWRVDPVAGTATRAGGVPKRYGWIFSNGFDKNSGVPFIESVNTAATDPAGNGDDDTRALERRGGEIWTSEAGDRAGEPKLPCGFGSGFAAADGTDWMFCADTPRLTTYRWTPGSKAWEHVGVSSRPVIPATADELPVVLPPVEGR